MDSGWRERLAAFCAPVFCASFPGGGEKGGGLVERVWGGGTWDIDSDCETHKNKTVTWLHMDTGGEKKKSPTTCEKGTESFNGLVPPRRAPRAQPFTAYTFNIQRSALGHRHALLLLYSITPLVLLRVQQPKHFLSRLCSSFFFSFSLLSIPSPFTWKNALRVWGENEKDCIGEKLTKTSEA